MKKNNKKSIEDRFIEVLKLNHLEYTSKLFNLGDKLYLPDFVFNTFIVEVEDCVRDNRLKRIQEFRKCFPSYTLVLLTDDKGKCVEAAKHFNEVFDWESIVVLLSEIRKHLREGRI